MKPPSHRRCWLLVLHLLVSVSPALLFSANAEAAGEQTATQKTFNRSSSPGMNILVFGDSTVDPGNNNYIGTIFRSNFPPYGKDFVNHLPTGRFTNGKLVTDFISGYLGIKETVPAYLDPSLSIKDLTTGVSFASAGTGFDPLTAQLSRAITIEDQLNYFREYKARIEEAIGKEKAKLVMKKTLFLISCGTNDYVVNYFSTPLRQYSLSVSQYQQFLLKLVHLFIQGLVAEGAETIMVAGLPPGGCLPVVITLNSNNAFDHRQCVDHISSAARQYNEGLQTLLNADRLRHPNVYLVYADTYTPINDIILNPAKYGFTYANCGCCGSGLIDAGPLCNPKSATCADDSKYVFWDAVHPTQATYHYLFKAMRPLIDAVRKNLDAH